MNYTRLPGKKRGLYRQASLWLGNDHILSVESNSYTENYKRFYFKDIQAILLRRTPRRRNTNIVLGALACGFLLLLAAGGGAAAFGTTIASGLLIGLLINSVLGPTCICHVKTPLAVHELPSLCRLKKARRALEKILPSIRDSQGDFSPDKMHSLTGNAGGIQPGPVAAGRQITSSPRQLPEAYGGGVHLIAFGLLLGHVIIACIQCYSPSRPVLALFGFETTALLILLITALIRQKGNAVTGPVRGMTWTALAVCTLSILTGYVYFILYLVRHHTKALFRDQDALISTMARVTPADNPLMIKVFIGFMVVLSLCGILGILGIIRMRSPGNAVSHSAGALRDGAGI